MLGQEAEEERMGGGRLLNGWEAGEIDVNIIFAIKKKNDLKGGSQDKRVRN